MKKSSLLPPRGFFLAWMPATVLWVCLSAPPAGGAPSEKPADPVMFIGLNVSAQQDGKFWPVLQVERATAVLAKERRTEAVKLNRLRLLQPRHTPKISSRTVNITELHHDWAHAIDRDPALEKMTEQVNAAGNKADEYRDATDSERAEMLATGEMRDPAYYGKTISSDEVKNIQDEEAFWSGYVANAETGEMPASFTVSFRLSSEQPLKQGYAVLLTRYRPTAKAARPVYAVMMQALPAIGPKPRKVTIEQEGLSVNSRIERCEIHIYDGPLEIATNHSQRRVGVAPYLAFKFLLGEHLLAHPDQDLAPAPVREFAEAAGSAWLPAAQLKRRVEIAVDDGGRVVELVLQPWPDASQDSRIEASVRALRLFPALARGKPVTGRTACFLGDLAGL